MIVTCYLAWVTDFLPTRQYEFALMLKIADNLY